MKSSFRYARGGASGSRHFPPLTWVAKVFVPSTKPTGIRWNGSPRAACSKRCRCSCCGGDRVVSELHAEFGDKLYWKHFQDQLKRVREGLADENCVSALSAEVASEIEQKYGRESLQLDEYQWAELRGKYAALGWVLGREWNDA